jgi:hypothetical protein
VLKLEASMDGEKKWRFKALEHIVLAQFKLKKVRREREGDKGDKGDKGEKGLGRKRG